MRIIHVCLSLQSVVQVRAAIQKTPELHHIARDHIESQIVFHAQGVVIRIHVRR